jgi:hypothetical protein
MEVVKKGRSLEIEYVQSVNFFSSGKNYLKVI